MKKVLILEDNKDILNQLKQIVENTTNNLQVIAVDNIKDAYYYTMQMSINLFIVDIILDTTRPGDASGLAFVSTIRQMEKYVCTPVIIVTSLEDEKMYTYETLHCYGFIEKPFDVNQIQKLVEQVLRYPDGKQKEKVLFFRKDGIIKAIQQEEIIYIQSENHVLKFYTIKDIVKIPYITLKQVMKQAESMELLQCSRGTLVNQKYIDSIDITNRYIILKDGRGKVEIGSAYKARIKEFLEVIM